MTRSGSPTALELRDAMECVVLPPMPGARPSSRPPVEIFLGTEPAQYRANRVFGYSIEKVRDPGREVRIYLMSELEGFDRRGWTTGFTNYRFAIPAFCGGRGRAIYNDEDEIYLTDPGVLFDLDLGGAGYLAISDTESSVMLIDCERMAAVWTLEEAQHAWKRALLRKAAGATGCRGDLDPGWNARDEEFVPGRSHLLHYTTLHTQPWRPFPERFVYQEGAYTQLWRDLEREAIARGFELFRRDAPSKRFAKHVQRLEQLPPSELPSGIGPAGEIARAVEALARQAKCRGWIELLPDLRGEAEMRPGRFGLDVERRMGLLEWLAEPTSAGRVDGLICIDGLEGLPVWDIPWVIDTLFARARGFMFVAVRCQDTPRRRFLYPPAGTAFTPDWWRSHFEAAAVRHPHVRWELLTTRGRDFARDGHHLAFGGPRLDATPPRIWTLTDGEPSQMLQVDALADALGGAQHSAGPSSPPLEPPWPDLLVVAGRAFADRAREIRREACGRRLVVAIGHEAALPLESVDLAVVQRGDVVFPHPRLVEIDQPLVAATGRGAHLVPRVAERLESLKHPRLVVAIDRPGREGTGFDARELLQLGRLIAESANRIGASLLIDRGGNITAAEIATFLRGIGDVDFAEGVDDDRVRLNLWPALRAAGDLFVAVGLPDQTLAEACSTGRPVFLAERTLPRQRTGLFERLRAAAAEVVVARARARPANDRGTTRPQEGLEWLAARLVASGFVRPRRDADALRERLLSAGHARVLTAALTAADLAGFPPPPPSDLERVVARVQALLGAAPAAS